MPTNLTIALAGHAPNRKSNIDSLLSDFLHLGSPDAEGYYALPDRWRQIIFYVLAPDGTLPAGLKPAMNLALSIEGDGVKVHLVTDKRTDAVEELAKFVDTVHEVADPLSELVDLLSDTKRSYLFINWDERDADDEHLINLAHRQGGIVVSDLVEGLTQICPDDADNDEEPEKEETPEPEPEPQERQSRRRRKTEPEPPAELEEDTPDLDDEPSEPAAKATVEETASLEGDIAAAQREQSRTTQTTIATGDVSVSSDMLRDVLKALDAVTVYMQAVDSANATKNLADTVNPSPLTKKLEKASASLFAVLNPQEPYDESLRKTAPDKPKKKAAGKGTRVIWDDDAQEWKKAGRGRPRAGARTGHMDDDGNVTED